MCAASHGPSIPPFPASNRWYRSMNIPRLRPMRLHLLNKPFDSPDWVFELKHDGFRCLAYIENGRCRLISRRNVVYKSFDHLKAALAKLRVKNAVLDGEL